MPNYADVYAVDSSVRMDADADRETIVRYLREYMLNGEHPPIPALARKVPKISYRDGREPLGQVSWKWSELTGKYDGCQFWSVGAAQLVTSLAEQRPWLQLRGACKAAFKRDCQPDSIQHEHVFPRVDWCLMMRSYVRSEQQLSTAELVDLLDRYCMGCVVTRSEHEQLTYRPSDRTNPWTRYSRTSIKLVENPAWSARHRAWIMEAGLM
jgi:hypothetical protein